MVEQLSQRKNAPVVRVILLCWRYLFFNDLALSMIGGFTRAGIVGWGFNFRTWISYPSTMYLGNTQIHAPNLKVLDWRPLDAGDSSLGSKRNTPEDKDPWRLNGSVHASDSHQKGPLGQREFGV
ncbi:hypothetical protein BDV30DRAFT_221172, partial [Aspergillus minisclerotigenes]